MKYVINMYDGKMIKINSYKDYFSKLADNMIELGKKREMVFLKSSIWIE
jgi:hypothetical protein